MELSTSWEAERFSAAQQIPPLLWNRNVHHRVHKTQQRDTILHQMKPVYSIQLHFLYTFYIILPSRSRFSKRPLSNRPAYRNTVLISSLVHVSYIPRSSHSPSCRRPNNVCITINLSAECLPLSQLLLFLPDTYYCLVRFCHLVICCRFDVKERMRACSW
jgi:hypothetical protein